MKRSVLKKRADISNNPEIIKLYKQQRNYIDNLVETLRQNISKSICYTIF